METNWRLIWIVIAPGRQCKFHAPSAAHKLLTKNSSSYNAENLHTKLHWGETLKRSCKHLCIGRNDFSIAVLQVLKQYSVCVCVTQ